MKNFFLFLAVLGISVSSANAGQPVFGPISITPLGSGIITTNTPVSGQTLFSGGGSIYYWDWATNSPATNIVLTGTVFKNAGSTAAFIANAGIYSTNFSVEAVNYVSNLTYQVILTAAFANDTIVSNGLITYVGNSTNLAYGYSRTIGAAGTNDVVGRFLSSTNLATTVHQGFVPALANDATKFFDSTGNYSVPAGGSGPAAGSNTLVSGSTVNLNNALTNIESIAFNGGAVISHGNPPGTMLSVSNNQIASGGVFGSDTNGLPFTISNGGTNSYISVINAKLYGLSPNGDQTANIQAAINAATNAGQKVFIPAGTYQLNGTLVVSRIELMGETPASGNSIGTILNPGGGANTIIYVPTGSSGTYIHNLSIVDGGAHHLATGISTSTNANPVGTSNIKIENCTFFGLSRDIYLNYAWDIQLIDNFYNDATVCVWGTNSVNAVDIWGGHFFGQFGVRCDGFACFNWNVHSVLEACSNAVFFANDCEQMNVTGSYFESSTYGIVANGTYALNLDHNEMDSASQTNIVLVGCKFPYIGGNRFSASGVASWDVDSTTFGLHIAQNSFNGSPSWRNAAATSFIQDGTNVFNTGGYASFVNNKASLMSSNLPTSATWLFTNSDLVNWICYITGGTVTGVSQNTSALAVSTTGITNASLTVILQPGESLGVTNGATAPRFSFKRF